LTTGGDNTSTTFSGVISGSEFLLNKERTFTLPHNTYTGGTNFNAGTLASLLPVI